MILLDIVKTSIYLMAFFSAAFVILYAFGDWWKNAVGQHLMVFMVAVAGLTINDSIALIWPQIIPSHIFRVEQTIMVVLLTVGIVWRFSLLLIFRLNDRHKEESDGDSEP